MAPYSSHRLYEERLAQCQEELAVLQKPSLEHPELLLMKKVIDRRLHQKIEYEQTLLRFKLESRQRESIAEKAQIHSQYVQTAAGIRDEALSRINKDIYQTQRERRTYETEKVEYMYEYNPKRSQQVAQQDLQFEGDRRLMNESIAVSAADPRKWHTGHLTNFRQAIELEREKNQRQAEAVRLRSSLDAASNYGGLPAGAEDIFMQKNAWANPQHPAHQLHRQASTVSQADGSMMTPYNQHQHLAMPHSVDSAATIAEQPSAPPSSVGPTPATRDQVKQTTLAEETPSKRPEEETPSKPHGTTTGKADLPTPNHAAVKPPSDKNRPGHSTPLTKYPVIKAEDPQLQHHGAVNGEIAGAHGIGAEAAVQPSGIST